MSYIIAGRAIKSEHLVLATLAATGGIVALARGGGSSKPKTAAKPVKQDFGASSREEEDFIKNFIAAAEKEDSKK